MKKDPIEKPLRKLLEDDQAPPFATMWARAQMLAEERRGTSVPLRRLLLSGASLAGVAAVVLVVYWVQILGPSKPLEERTGEQRIARINPHPGLKKLVEIDPWTSVFEGLSSDWEIAPITTNEEEKTTVETSELAVVSSSSQDRSNEEKALGEGVLYESPTDFLLRMEVPAWKESEERSVL